MKEKSTDIVQEDTENWRQYNILNDAICEVQYLIYNIQNDAICEVQYLIYNI